MSSRRAAFSQRSDGMRAAPSAPAVTRMASVDARSLRRPRKSACVQSPTWMCESTITAAIEAVGRRLRRVDAIHEVFLHGLDRAGLHRHVELLADVVLVVDEGDRHRARGDLE